MRSFDAAAQSVSQERFVDFGGRHTGLAQLQEIRSVRLIVFVFGALPQIIKLYAMRGILCTQICASLFFGSFLIIEAVMLWLNKYRNTTQGLDGHVIDRKDSIRILRVLTLSISYVSPLWLIVTAIWRKQASFRTLCLFFCLMEAFSMALSSPPSPTNSETSELYRLDYIFGTLIDALGGWG